MTTPTRLSTIFTKGDNICDFLFASLGNEPFQKQFTLKGRNLLLQEQILSFTSWTSMRREEKIKMAELPPWKVCLFPLMSSNEMINTLLM